MSILPQNEQKRLRVVLFPLKAYVVLAPLIYFVLPQSYRSGQTSTGLFVAYSLGFDSFILLLIAFILANIGPRGYALSTAIFGVAAFIIMASLFPARA
jgi:hypothetical protein